MVTIIALVDEVDDTVGQVRLVGHQGLPDAAVRGILQYTLAQEKGYRKVETLAAEGWEFCPEGPVWNEDVDGDTSLACWTWDYNRAS